MNINISKDPKALGQAAAKLVAKELNKAIAENGEARILVSTGASQFETLDALIKEDVDFSKVEMFHLDEYIGLPIVHKASFRKYLQERLISKVNFRKTYLVEGEGDIESNIKMITEEIRRSPIDVGVIGIGENAHVAFNDPPADFDSEDAYIIVDLDDACKKQQVGEGWFDTVGDVPNKAISMTINEILKCKIIVSSVPNKIKAQAVKNSLSMKETNTVPATVLKRHGNWNLFLDSGSASKFIDC